MDEALSLLAGLSEQVPADGRVALEWGRTLAGWTGDREGARAQLDRALEVAPGLSAARFERAMLALSGGDAAVALSDLEQLLQGGFRQHVLLHLHRARALEQLGRLDEAESAWSAAITAGEPGAWLLRQRARLRVVIGEWLLAEEDFTAAIALEREAGEEVAAALLLERALVREARGERTGALDDARAARGALWPEEAALAEQVDALLRKLTTEGGARAGLAHPPRAEPARRAPVLGPGRENPED